jgi:hypothetical protein
VCPPITIAYLDSYYGVNMIHALFIWVFILLILGAHIDYENRSDF